MNFEEPKKNIPEEETGGSVGDCIPEEDISRITQEKMERAGLRTDSKGIRDTLRELGIPTKEERE